MKSLILEKDGKKLLNYPLIKERTSIGRDPTNDIVLPDEEISRLHCEIIKSGERFTVIDASKNGTYINNRPEIKRSLTKKDKLKCGNWLFTLSTDEEKDDEPTKTELSTGTKIRDPKSCLDSDELPPIQLTIKSNSGEQFTKTLKKHHVKIGSNVWNDLIVTDDEYISGNHAILTAKSDNSLFLTDLGSTNGTFYKGEKIDRTYLPEKATFTVGKTEIQVKYSTKTDIKQKAHQLGHMIGVSDSMKNIFTLVKRVAPTDATVCITGESGTGKELVARSIHSESTLSRGPFVAINCGALPPTIIESELFGHEKGAFTGATQMRQGVFEQANDGILFLDEIGEMPFELQTRLLRVLETRKIRRIGGTRDIPVDVRIVTATNQDLKKNVSEGKFREDLFFRLYIIPIHIQPLRERKEDIEILARHFTKIFSITDEEIDISKRAIEKLNSHTWTGNARELKNTIQRAIILNGGNTIKQSDITLSNLNNAKDTHSMPLLSQEKQAIIETLKRCNGNQSKAADILGIARTTLFVKIKKYEIDVKSLKMT